MYYFRYHYYDKIVPQLQRLKQRRLLFDEWKTKLLCAWQHRVLRRIMSQNDRSIIWVSDPVGNHGKTFFAKYLAVLYNFQYLGGQVSYVLPCKL